MAHNGLDSIRPDDLDLAIRAIGIDDAGQFANPFDLCGLERWEFSLIEALSFDNATEFPTPVGGAQVVLARDVNIAFDDWFDVFEGESSDMATIALDLQNALDLDFNWEYQFEDPIVHLVVIDRIDIVTEFRGYRLSKLLVDAVHRMFRGGLVLLVPSELDERERLIEAGITDSGINDRGSEVEKKRQLLRSEENFRKLQKYWMSMGFEKLAGRTLYLPPKGIER